MFDSFELCRTNAEVGQYDIEEDSDPIQQVQNQEFKGAIDTLFTFASCDT